MMFNDHYDVNLIPQFTSANLTPKLHYQISFLQYEITAKYVFGDYNNSAMA